MKLSIIVPVYNVESFLEFCVSSLYRQNLDISEYEVILVNDGSTDDSKAIAVRLQQEHSNIRLINQVNQGLSGARNTGIANAHGDYIWCIDSDDEIEDNCLDIIVDEIEKHDFPDLYGIILDEVNKDKKHLNYQCDQPSMPHGALIKGSQAIIGGFNPSSACALIMRKTFLDENELRFKVGITHEDVEFTYRAMAVADRVYFSNNKVYYYYRWGNTMSTAKDTERLLKYVIDDIEVAKSFTELAERTKDERLASVIMNRRNNILWGLVYSLLCNRQEWRPKRINQVVIERMKREDYYPLKGRFDSWKKRLLVPVLNCEKLMI